MDLPLRSAYRVRMETRTRRKGRKKAVKLSIDAELLTSAREQGLSLSALLEQALAEEYARRWLQENKEAIETHNEDVRQNGIWSDGLRRW
jgi:antitoxin CcdA